MNNAQKNAQTPAFPVMPVADQFGTIHVFPGQTKQEYLAAQIFLQLFEKLRDDIELAENQKEMKGLLGIAKQTSFLIADFFYMDENKNNPIVKTGLHGE
jgi:hypothetical protein